MPLRSSSATGPTSLSACGQGSNSRHRNTLPPLTARPPLCSIRLGSAPSCFATSWYVVRLRLPHALTPRRPTPKAIQGSDTPNGGAERLRHSYLGQTYYYYGGRSSVEAYSRSTKRRAAPAMGKT